MNKPSIFATALAALGRLFGQRRQTPGQDNVRLLGAIESLQEGFALFDADDRLIAVNGEYRRITPDAQEILERGGTFEELIRANVKRGEIVDALGREEDYIRERIAQHRDPKGPVLLQRTDGWYLIKESRTPDGGIALTFTDVTELRQAEEALRKSEALFKAIVNHSPAKIHIKDSDGRYILINKEAEKLFGISEKEGLGKTTHDLFPKDVADEYSNHDREVMVFGKAIEAEEEFILDGGVRTFLTVKFPIADLDGISAVGAIGTDITYRKYTEQLNTRLGRIIDQSLNEIFTFDAETLRFTQANQGALANLGYTLAELQKRTPIDIKPEFTREGFEEIIQPLRDGTRERIVFETVHRRKDGSTYDTEVHLQLMQTETPAVFVAITQDITERKQADTARRASEETTRAIIENVVDSVIAIDEKGIIETFNPAAETIFGYDASEVLGRNVSMLMATSDREKHDKYISRYLTTGETKIIGSGREVTGFRKDGTEFPAQLSISEMTSPEWTEGEKRRTPRRRFIGTIQDLTDRKQIEAALRRSQKMEAVGQLSGGIAHDFNNLLSIIIGNLDFLTRFTEADPKLHEPLISALNAALRGARLTERLLGFSQQSMALVSPTEVNAVIEGLDEILTKSLTAQIDIELDLSGDLWLCEIDSGELEDALINLSLNARDAMPDGGTFAIGTRNVTLDPGFVKRNPDATAGDYVEITVGDTGSGIPRDVIDKIFDPFFTTKEAGKGTGLGLSMVYGFVKRSKGHIKVSSSPGRGTKIVMRLPKTSESILDGLDREPDDLPKGSETILAVDDEKDLVHLIKVNLEQLGYNVLIAYDAEKALKILNEEDGIALLLTDVVMPGDLNGFELAEQATELYPGLKVLISTGYSGKQEGNGRASRKFKKMIRKPYRYPELAMKVRQTLDATN